MNHETPAGTAGVDVSAHAGSSGSNVSSARDRRLAEAGILVTVVIWSLNFVVVKAFIEDVGPLTFSGTRYAIAALTLFLIVRVRLGTIRIAPRQAVPLLGLGVLGFGCYQVAWSLGLTHITAGDSALIVALSPVLTAVLAGIVGLDRLTGPKVGGAVVAFVGVALVITGGAAVNLGISLVGDGLTLVAAILWALYTVIGTRLLRGTDPLQAAAWTVLGGAMVLVPLAIWESLTTQHGGVTVGTGLAILFSGSLAAGAATILVLNAIRHVGPTRATVGQLLVPAGAVFLGAVFLAEPVRLMQVVGGAVIMTGLWLSRRPSVLPVSVRARLGSR